MSMPLVEHAHVDERADVWLEDDDKSLHEKRY